ncbi:MAG: hypothetical protein IKA00_04310 [Prevotella sp.]|nr:hypothetical protein [Prevotella sp.]MBR2035475.1 hypothetical protein [Prevotella sp.]
MRARFNKRQFGLSKIKSLQTGLTSLTSVTLINKKTLITIFIRNHSQLLFAFAHQHVVVVEKNHWQNRTIYESKLHHFWGESGAVMLKICYENLSAVDTILDDIEKFFIGVKNNF